MYAHQLTHNTPASQKGCVLGIPYNNVKCYCLAWLQLYFSYRLVYPTIPNRSKAKWHSLLEQMKDNLSIT